MTGSLPIRRSVHLAARPTAISQPSRNHPSLAAGSVDAGPPCQAQRRRSSRCSYTVDSPGAARDRVTLLELDLEAVLPRNVDRAGELPDIMRAAP